MIKSPQKITPLNRKLSVRLIILAVMVGVFAGVGGYTFNFAEGLSYFSKDPKACMNCHIMNSQYDSWLKNSHHGVATCVDCHLPDDFFGKYLAKGENGYHHSVGFTFQNFHEPIQIKSKNSQILQDNCLRCHEPMVENMLAGATTDPDAVRCVHCHQGVGHGQPAGIGGPDRGEIAEKE